MKPKSLSNYPIIISGFITQQTTLIYSPDQSEAIMSFNNNYNITNLQNPDTFCNMKFNDKLFPPLETRGR